MTFSFALPLDSTTGSGNIPVSADNVATHLHWAWASSPPANDGASSINIHDKGRGGIDLNLLAGSTPQLNNLQVDGYSSYAALDNTVGVSWTLDASNQELQIALKAKTTGWVALEFAKTPNAMVGGDAVFGWVDSTGTGNVKAFSIPSYNGDDVAAAGIAADDYFSTIGNGPSSEQVDGFTVVKFSIDLTKTTEAAGRVPLSLDNVATAVNYAVCDSPPPDNAASTIQKHNIGYGPGSINFAGGASTLPPPPDANAALLFIVAATLGVGMIAAHAPAWVRRTCLARCVLQWRCCLCWRSRGKLVQRSVRQMWMDTLLDFTWGEFFLWLAYLIAVFGVFAPTFYGVTQNWRRTSGWCTAWQFVFVSLPVTRTSLMLVLLGIPFERAVKHHRIMARVLFASLIAHLVLILDFVDLDINEIMNPEAVPPGVKDAHTYPLYGTLCFISTTLMVFFALPVFRRRVWEMFVWVHQMLVLPTFALAYFHVDDPTFRVAVASPAILYVIDRFARQLQYRRKVIVLDGRFHDGGDAPILELRMKLLHGSLNNGPGDYAFFLFPQVSRFHTHPFSISSPPPVNAPGKSVDPVRKWHDGAITIHCKDMGEGTFTRRVHDHVRRLMDDETLGVESLDIGVEGPFGKLSLHVEDYESIWLVAGGIGVTPMASVLGYLWKRKQHKKGHSALPALKEVHLAWCVRSARAFEMFRDEFVQITDGKETGTLNGCKFHLHLHNTRKAQGGSAGAAAGADAATEAKGADTDAGRTMTNPLARGSSVQMRLLSAEADLPPLPHKTGRPDLTKMMGDFPTKGPRALLVCGPQPLVDSATASARANGIHDIHSEVFTF